jgi:hypothetical protein
LVIAAQRDGLLTDLLQLGLVAQVQAEGDWLRLQQLTQTQFYSIGVGTVILKGPSDRLFNQVSRIVPVQLQHPNKLARPLAFRLPALQLGQQLLVDRWPSRPPLADRLGVVECAGPLDQ